MAITTGNPQSTKATTNANSFTLASYNVAAGADRLLAVMVSLLRSNESGASVTGVTFGGVALTEAVNISGTSTSRSNYAGIWYLVAPNVSTADIVATANAAMAGAIVAALTLYGVNQTTPKGVTLTASNTTNVVNLFSETGVTAGGLAVTVATANSNNTPMWDLGDGPTSVTEMYDLNNGSDNNEIAGAGGYVANGLFLGNLRAGNYALCSVTPARHVGVMAEFLPAPSGSLYPPRRPRTYIRL